MKTREDLKTDYYLQTGEEWLNSQNEPDIDYVQWLEDKVLCSESMRDEKEEKAYVNYFQIKELTDEEWMKLPKEEILQLYRNCYTMLRRFVNYMPDESFKKFSLLKDSETVTSSDTIIPTQPGRGAEGWLQKNAFDPNKIVFCENGVSGEKLSVLLEEYRTQSEGKDMYPKDKPRFLDWFYRQSFPVDPDLIFEWFQVTNK